VIDPPTQIWITGAMVIDLDTEETMYASVTERRALEAGVPVPMRSNMNPTSGSAPFISETVSIKDGKVLVQASHELKKFGADGKVTYHKMFESEHVYIASMNADDAFPDAVAILFELKNTDVLEKGEYNLFGTNFKCSDVCTYVGLLHQDSSKHDAFDAHFVWTRRIDQPISKRFFSWRPRVILNGNSIYTTLAWYGDDDLGERPYAPKAILAEEGYKQCVTAFSAMFMAGDQLCPDGTTVRTYVPAETKTVMCGEYVPSTQFIDINHVAGFDLLTGTPRFCQQIGLSADLEVSGDNLVVLGSRTLDVEVQNGVIAQNRGSARALHLYSLNKNTGKPLNIDVLHGDADQFFISGFNVDKETGDTYIGFTMNNGGMGKNYLSGKLLWDRTFNTQRYFFGATRVGGVAKLSAKREALSCLESCAGGFTSVLKQGYCNVDGLCIRNLEAYPGLPCKICNVSYSTSTLQDYKIGVDYCYFDGLCHAKGDAYTQVQRYSRTYTSQCQKCLPSVSSTGYSLDPNYELLYNFAGTSDERVKNLPGDCKHKSTAVPVATSDYVSTCTDSTLSSVEGDRVGVCANAQVGFVCSQVWKDGLYDHNGKVGYTYLDMCPVKCQNPACVYVWNPNGNTGLVVRNSPTFTNLDPSFMKVRVVTDQLKAILSQGRPFYFDTVKVGCFVPKSLDTSLQNVAFIETRTGSSPLQSVSTPNMRDLTVACHDEVEDVTDTSKIVFHTESRVVTTLVTIMYRYWFERNGGSISLIDYGAARLFDAIFQQNVHGVQDAVKTLLSKSASIECPVAWKRGPSGWVQEQSKFDFTQIDHWGDWKCDEDMSNEDTDIYGAFLSVELAKFSGKGLLTLLVTMTVHPTTGARTFGNDIYDIFGVTFLDFVTYMQETYGGLPPTLAQAEAVAAYVNGFGSITNILTVQSA
jgi:hypothetical protein